MHTTAQPVLEAAPMYTGPSSTEGPRLPHMPGLNGVRGVAVLGVVAYHLDHLRGGYLGVDAFFVLSGFLITSLLLVEVEASGRVDLGAFWARRARRLLPALVVVIAAVVLVASVVSTPAELASLRGDSLASLFYVANWRDIVTDTSYWGMFQAPSPLRHMWSLAIEEQFYLLWPLVFAVVAVQVGRRARTWIAIIAVSGLAVSAVACGLLFDPADPSRAYYGTDTRAAAIFFGALAAWVVRRRPAGAALGRRATLALDVTAGVAIAALAVAWVRLPGTSALLYHGGLLACGLAATVVILACALAPGGVVARVLSVRPLAAVGLVSYGLYLWHWPIIVWLTPARTGLDGVWLLGLRLGVMTVVVLASYYLVERPIRHGSLAPRQLLVWGGAAAICCLGLILALTNGPSVPVLASSGGAPTPAADAPSRRPASPAPTAARAPAPVAEAAPTTVAVVGAEPGLLPPAPGTAPATVAPTTPAAPPRVLVVGDSGAWFLGEAMAAEAPRLGAVVLSRGWIGCGVAREGGGVRVGDGPLLRDPDGCADWPTRWQQDLQSFQPDHVLLMLSWPGLGDRKIQGEWLHPCSPVFDAYFQGEVSQALSVLGSTGARVYVATAPYFTANGAPAEAADRVDCLNRTYRQAAELTGAQILDLEGWVCPDGQCRRDENGVVLREDGLHFSGGGAVIAADWTLDHLARSTA